MSKKIKSILVTGVAPMSDHAANRGEKLLGNASSVKRRPDGRVYISGQMQRHVLFSAIDRINEDHPERGETYVANGDAPSTQIDKDLRSDLGGFLDTKKGDYSGRRTAPISATPAVAINPSSIGRDLLIRLKMDDNTDSNKKQALATNEFSIHDEMIMNFHLDVGVVGVTKKYSYENEYHVSTTYESAIDDEEHRRRIGLFLEGTASMTDFANQARNAVSGEPNRVLIVLDNKMSRKAARYFQPETTDIERENILEELTERGAHVFLGDDTTKEGLSVAKAYRLAMEVLSDNELYRPPYEQ
ncbi:MAG: type I-PGING CRISPR-associated protein Cas7/Csp1 [Lewinellaceae bacterium]|nr:type I-PGING CRISPR-associated protein Cas7/Csp1 [Lewinellaceae bacterium]